MTKANLGYLGQHRPGSIRERLHKEFDAKGENGLAAALALGEKIRRETGGEKPKESTIRTWASHWKNHPEYGTSEQYRAARDRRTPSPTVTNAPEGFAEETRLFGGEHARRTSSRTRTVSVPVEIDEGLLMEAKTMAISLSRLVEEELRERVKAQRGRRWAEENKEFIESYNAYIERNGVFGEDLLDLDDPPV
jgi:antitoxin CcdA